MKNEKLAYAMTHIDDDLITEAARIERSGSRVLTLQRALVRWGSLAACLILAVGIVLGSMSPGVTMNGQALDSRLTPLSAATPRSLPQTASHTADTALEFTLDFAKSTTLTPETGNLALVNSDGSLTPVTDGHTVRGAVTLRLTLSAPATSATVTTDRGYRIILSLIGDEWFVNIEK